MFSRIFVSFVFFASLLQSKCCLAEDPEGQDSYKETSWGTTFCSVATGYGSTPYEAENAAKERLQRDIPQIIVNSELGKNCVDPSVLKIYPSLQLIEIPYVHGVYEDGDAEDKIPTEYQAEVSGCLFARCIPPGMPTDGPYGAGRPWGPSGYASYSPNLFGD